ncbi:MAG: M64 family metallopeptidase [Flavobacteriaceae bacterium]
MKKTNQRTYYLLIFIFAFNISCSKDDSNTKEDLYFDNKEVEVVFENNPENGINVIFMGDGYLKEDLTKPYGYYNYHAIKHIKKLFEVPPFSTYKEHFNAYIVYAESVDRDTYSAFNTKFESGNISSINRQKIYNYARIARPDYDESKDIIMVSLAHGKGGGVAFSYQIAVFDGNSERTMLHEVGHVYTKLGDEYYYDNTTAPLGLTLSNRPNLDVTPNYDEIKWNFFFGLEEYPEVGAFEGGYYYENGVWRPTNNSIMKSLEFPYFNAVSREAIVRKIYSDLNLTYKFEVFLESDVPNFLPVSNSTENINYDFFVCGNTITNN